MEYKKSDDQSEMKQLLTKLERKNTLVDVLLLCETFLTEDNTKLINVPNYTLILLIEKQ